MASHHCRCRTCGARRKLKMHPDAYRLQPRCRNCRSRNWRRDNYRHNVELPQMRSKTGRYRLCPYHCFHHEHRLASTGCRFNFDLTVREASSQHSELI